MPAGRGWTGSKAETHGVPLAGGRAGRRSKTHRWRQVPQLRQQASVTAPFRHDSDWSTVPFRIESNRVRVGVWSALRWMHAMRMRARAARPERQLQAGVSLQFALGRAPLAIARAWTLRRQGGPARQSSSPTATRLPHDRNVTAT
jgi:hypothetical protein